MTNKHIFQCKIKEIAPLCYFYVKSFYVTLAVHKDITERLSDLNPTLAVRVHAVLDKNKAERHIRGGMATREKYLRLSKIK